MIKDYVGKGQPLFIEGNVFSVQVPIPKRINEGAFEGAFEGATKVIEKKLITLIEIIAINEGSRTPELRNQNALRVHQ